MHNIWRMENILTDFAINEYEVKAYTNNEVYTMYAPNLRVLLAFLYKEGLLTENDAVKIKQLCDYPNLIPNQKEL